MEQWGETLTKLGAVGGSVYVFGKFVWPFLIQQVNKAEARHDAVFALLREQRLQFAEELRELSKMYAESLRARDTLAVEAHRDQMKALNQVTAELKTLNTYIRNGSGGWRNTKPND
jgi:hypothetical protein